MGGEKKKKKKKKHKTKKRDDDERGTSPDTLKSPMSNRPTPIRTEESTSPKNSSKIPRQLIQSPAVKTPKRNRQLSTDSSDIDFAPMHVKKVKKEAKSGSITPAKRKESTTPVNVPPSKKVKSEK